MNKYIEKAIAELQQKTLNDIQQETALVWAGRSCAAAQFGLHHDAIEYAHESIEHAALSGNNALLNEVRAVMKGFGVQL